MCIVRGRTERERGRGGDSWLPTVNVMRKTSQIMLDEPIYNTIKCSWWITKEYRLGWEHQALMIHMGKPMAARYNTYLVEYMEISLPDLAMCDSILCRKHRGHMHHEARVQGYQQVQSESEAKANLPCLRINTTSSSLEYLLQVSPISYASTWHTIPVLLWY